MRCQRIIGAQQEEEEAQFAVFRGTPFTFSLAVIWEAEKERDADNPRCALRMQWLAPRQSPHPGPKPPAAAGPGARAFAEEAGEHLRLSALGCATGRDGGKGENICEGFCFFFRLLLIPAPKLHMTVSLIH